MAKTIKAVLKKQVPDDSKFWVRMQAIVKDSAFGRLSVEKQNRVLDFFRPEWEARNGSFFPRLEEFTSDVWPIDAIDYSILCEYTGSTAVTTLANHQDFRIRSPSGSFNQSLRSAMQLVLTLAAEGVVSRTTPVNNPDGVPLYNFSINQEELLTLVAGHRGFFAPFSPDFLKEVFKPELTRGSFGFVFKTLKSMSEVEAASVEDARQALLSSTAPVSPAEVQMLGRCRGFPRAAVTKAILTLCNEEPDKFQRAAPYVKMNSDGSPVPVVKFRAQDSKPRAQKEQPVLQFGELRALIDSAVSAGLQKILLDPDKIQMEAIRAMLVERRLPTDDPVATLRAKLSKKRLPETKA